MEIYGLYGLYGMEDIKMYKQVLYVIKMGKHELLINQKPTV